MVMPSSSRSSLVLQATATCFRLLPLMLILQNVELVLSNDAETVAFLYPHNLPALGVIGDEGGLCHWIAWPVVRVRLREVLRSEERRVGTECRSRWWRD